MEDKKLVFKNLLDSLELREIEKKSFSVNKNGFGKIFKIEENLIINVNLKSHDDDPLELQENLVLFRPIFSVSIIGENNLRKIEKASETHTVSPENDKVEIKSEFQLEVFYAVYFQLKDRKGFFDCWKIDELRKIFIEQQLQKLLWPFLRQLTSDSMNSLNLNSIALPLLL